MDRTPHIPARQETQRIACVHCDSPILGFDPFPGLGGMVLDLESSNGLAEEEGDGTKVYVRFVVNRGAKRRGAKKANQYAPETTHPRSSPYPPSSTAYTSYIANDPRSLFRTHVGS